MLIYEAYESWDDLIMPLVIEQYGEDDEVALDESWSSYTDSLCKDGALTSLQYLYCPSFDSADMPRDEEEERDFILSELGVGIKCEYIPTQMPDIPFKRREIPPMKWKVEINRDGRFFYVDYQMGIGHNTIYKEAIRRSTTITVFFYDFLDQQLKTGEAQTIDDVVYDIPKPEVQDVIFSLLMDTSGDLSNFDDWCAEYDYNNDSITALNMLNACKEALYSLQRMFSEQELEDLRTLFEDF